MSTSDACCASAALSNPATGTSAGSWGSAGDGPGKRSCSAFRYSASLMRRRGEGPMLAETVGGPAEGGSPGCGAAGSPAAHARGITAAAATDSVARQSLTGRAWHHPAEPASPHTGDTRLDVARDPLAAHLARGGVEAVPQVDEADGHDERAELRLVVVADGLVPDLIRHGVGAIAQPRRRLCQRERGALGVGVVRRLAPGADGEDALVLLAELLERARVHVDAHAAPVDLAGAQVGQLDGDAGQAGLLDRLGERLEAFERARQRHHGALHAGFHGWVSPSAEMTIEPARM